MLNRKSLKYLMLIVLAEFGDAGIEFLVNYVAKGKRIVLGRKPYRSSYFRQKLKELTTTGYIERISKGGVAYLRLTTAGHSRLKRDIPLPYLQQKKWDGFYRALAYDFPEKERYNRDSFRWQAESWGMGMLQKSVWITPYPLEEPLLDFIALHNLGSKVLVLKTTELGLEEGREIAARVWQTDRTAKIYEKFIDKWLTKGKQGKLIVSDLQKIQLDFFSLIAADPHLPYDLLPKEWPAFKAKKLFVSILKIISREIKHSREKHKK